MTLRRFYLLAIALAAALFSATAGRAAPIAYWTFDAIPDDVVGPSDGVLNGGATYSFLDVAPIPGNIASLELDGAVGSYYGVTPQIGSVSGSYTVSAWANIRSNANPNNIFSTRRPADQSFDVKFQNGTLIHGDIGGYNQAGTAAWGNTAADAALAYNLNQWYHVAYVVTPTRWRAYVNGSQAASGVYTPNTAILQPLLFDNAHEINIGRYNGGSEHTNGFIDDVSVFNYALTPAQVSALATGTSPLAIAGPDRHGALNYIPITNDADSQISAAKTYTHAIDFGTGSLGAANVNGVQFDAGVVGNFPSGNGSTNLPAIHGGNNAYNGMGSVGALFQDMLYNAGEGVITLTGLTPGEGYDTRLYIRNWVAPAAGSRQNMIEFDTDGDGLAERVTRINEDNATNNAPGFADINQAYALSYTFVADSPTLTIRANQIVGNATFHLYGLTNEVTDRRPIDSLFSTGLDASGARLLGGQPDPHYVLVSAPQGSQAIAIINHPVWAPNDASSGFIGVVDPGATNVAVGEYRFATSFDLTGFQENTAEIVMTVFVDNTLVDVLINGQSTGITLSAPPATPAANQTFAVGGGKTFKLNTGFVAGINSLEFVMSNDGTAVNPGGIRVDLGGTAVPIPEPSSFMLGALGIGALALVRRRTAWARRMS